MWTMYREDPFLVPVDKAYRREEIGAGVSLG